MADFEFIEFGIESNVALVCLNRPDDGNALVPGMAQELRQVALYCQEDSDIRAVIITGNGKMFCAGGDVKEFASHGRDVGYYTKEITHPLHAAISQFNWMDAPVVGAINGTAAGGGFSLALAPDIAVAAESAKFTMAYTNTGLTPDGSSTFFLARMIGLRRAKELALLNPVLTAEQAVEWGFINRVVPDDMLMEETMEIAIKLARGPTHTIGETKRLLLNGTTASLETQMEMETRVIAKISTTEDGLEGIKAFTKKRTPKFTGK